jgi:hypothetical protein
MLTKAQIEEANRKVKEKARSLVADNGVGPLLADKLINYAWTVGWVEANHDRCVHEGVRQFMNKELNKYSRPRSKRAGRQPFVSTLADQHDVDFAMSNGDVIGVGQDIRKNAKHLSIAQIVATLRRMIKSVQPQIKDIVYLRELYKLRTGKQFVLPFDVSIEVQMEMKRLAEEDLRSA